jgi:hypothetical protein
MTRLAASSDRLLAPLRLARLALLAALLTGLPAETAGGLNRTGPDPLPYDLAAERPWLPLLWHGAALTLPGDAPARIQLTASFAAGADGSDLLALRDGPRLTLGANTGLIDATSPCTWSGVAIGPGGALTASSDAAVDADRALAMIRQLHYANLGGPRALTPRSVRLEIRTLGANGVLVGTALLLSLAPADAPTPPILRFDSVRIDTGGSAAWAPTACHLGRGELASVRWALAGSAALPITGIDGGQRMDLRPLLALGGLDLDAFAALALRLEAPATEWTGSLPLTVAAGVSGPAWSPVAVSDPDEGLRVVGDPPFAVGPEAAEFTLKTDRSTATLLRCVPHPGEDPGADRTHFTVIQSGLELRLRVDPAAHPGVGLLQGEMVIGAGPAQVRLPYRIVLRHGSGG